MDLDFGLPLRHHGLPPLFDPEEGHTVVEPLDSGSGWWAGAPSAVWDHETAKFYLYYRLRRPRGVELDRGGECVIAESTDGINFNPIWRAEKTAFESDSVERAALFKGLDNVWRLYLSYVDPDHQMWRVDLMEADRPDRSEPASRHTVFDPVDLNIEGIKDPFVFTLGHEYYMLLSYTLGESHQEAGRGSTRYGRRIQHRADRIKNRPGHEFGRSNVLLGRGHLLARLIGLGRLVHSNLLARLPAHGLYGLLGWSKRRLGQLRGANRARVRNRHPKASFPVTGRPPSRFAPRIRVSALSGRAPVHGPNPLLLRVRA